MAKPQSVISLDAIDRKKELGFIGKLLITTYHGGKSPLKTLPFGHYMFCGPQRSGKSTSFIWYAEYLSKKMKKKRLWYFDKEKKQMIRYKNPPKIKLYSNVGLGKSFSRKDINKLIHELDPDSNEVRIFLIDEVHTYFPKEGTTKEEKEMIAKLNATFSQLGKRNVYVLSTAQIYGRLDKALREQCLFMVNCYIGKLSGRIVNEFIPQENIIADDLGRWAGRPTKILKHGLQKSLYDTKKLIHE